MVFSLLNFQKRFQLGASLVNFPQEVLQKKYGLYCDFRTLEEEKEVEIEDIFSTNALGPCLSRIWGESTAFYIHTRLCN